MHFRKKHYDPENEVARLLALIILMRAQSNYYIHTTSELPLITTQFLEVISAHSVGPFAHIWTILQFVVRGE